LLYVDKLKDKIIGPNSFDHKVNLHLNDLRRQFQEKKDQENFKKKFLSYKADFQIEKIYKYLEEEVNAKFNNVKIYYEFNKYLGSKLKKYDKRINLAKNLTKTAFFKSLLSFTNPPLTKRASVASTISTLS
jgi:hypothetical protein